MDNLLESNERTLIIFDSVCSGLSSCLALVHADIKQMTEHRNRLAQLEQEKIQAKLIPAQDLLVKGTDEIDSSDNLGARKGIRNGDHETSTTSKDEDDPHHLAGLKLLDKRLADSFSQALSLNDLQKSSIAAKQHANQSRPSIFQVLLGKYSSKNDLSKKGDKLGKLCEHPDESRQPDNRMIIDDINRQTRLAMQYSKQLEAHLFKVEDLRGRYEMHLKMGLVVKSVSRAYLGNGGSCNSSPRSMVRNPNCSSLIVNDTSSMGTHSSMSSLNLSTWSSSRSKAKKRRSTGNQNGDGRNEQIYVSTISLNNSHQKQNGRLNLLKLISPTSSSSSTKNQQLYDQEPHYVDPSTLVDPNRRVSSHTIAPQTVSPYSAASQAEWAAQETIYSNLSNNNISMNGTLSKSSTNLHASRHSLKSGKSKSQQAAASRTTIKEFIENIDKIESEFESYMGSFMLAIEDIQGFARVCHGDVFEITIKYGDSQKFKTKISVLKDNRQKCDHRQTVFKARIADVLAIKAYEYKGLGKRVLLGHKLCETRDLFTAQSQLMTISLNQTGSIKLNLIVTWNPLHMAPNSSTALPGLDISHISLPPTPISSSTLSSVSSGLSLNGRSTTINIESQQQPHRGKLNHPSQCTDHSHQRNQQRQSRHQESVYQAVDPTYGYYIPPPDYLTNDVKY